MYGADHKCAWDRKWQSSGHCGLKHAVHIQVAEVGIGHGPPSSEGSTPNRQPEIKINIRQHNTYVEHSNFNLVHNSNLNTESTMQIQNKIYMSIYTYIVFCIKSVYRRPVKSSNLVQNSRMNL